MTTYLKVAKAKTDMLSPFSIRQIPREQNTQVDTLANLGSELRKSPFDVVPLVHLSSPSIEDSVRVHVLDEEDEWSKEIKDYLMHDQLLEDKLEARRIHFRASRSFVKCTTENVVITLEGEASQRGCHAKAIIGLPYNRTPSSMYKFATHVKDTQANRTTPHTPTGQTPLYLVYGCEIVLLVEVTLPVARLTSVYHNLVDLSYNLDALEELIGSHP
ncbi:hypothetical protein L6452_34171 [Arctium lappa]|uniref:Uncharacterized protein n=1 Tax=Arctium lappa TaxID=4217 RepID=A0ACB8YI53_ARCLA|nr:hypothetical protein L6452_34171 [Arctium lappa]